MTKFLKKGRSSGSTKTSSSASRSGALTTAANALHLGRSRSGNGAANNSRANGSKRHPRHEASGQLGSLPRVPAGGTSTLDDVPSTMRSVPAVGSTPPAAADGRMGDAGAGRRPHPPARYNAPCLIRSSGDAPAARRGGGGYAATPGRTLHRRQLSRSVSISRHYELNGQFLSLFDATYRNELWVVAYEIGRNFVETAVFDIPKHGYYRSGRHAGERERSELDALRVADMLEVVAERMGGGGAEEGGEPPPSSSVVEAALGDESTRASLRREAAGLTNLAREVAEPETLERYLRDRDAIMADFVVVQEEDGGDAKRRAGAGGTTIGAEDILEDLENLSFCCSASDWSIIPSLFPQAQDRSPQSSLSKAVAPTTQPLQQAHVSAVAEPSSQSLYPPIVSPHSSLTSTLDVREDVVDYARHDGAWEVLPSSSRQGVDLLSPSTAGMGDGKMHGSDVIPVTSLRQCYWEDWQSLKNQQEILFTFLDTYQGRLPESTNGCTVIAPLLAMHHLQSDGPGIADSTIDEVIDYECSTILPEVRDELGLTKDALIIPSDVHDYLIEQGLLGQDQFVGVCGGNIMDPGHVNEFIKMLNCEEEYECHKGKKVAAALFFHEHVVCILRMNFSDGRCWYDLIDSLPSAMLMTGTQDEAGWTKSAVRIRCKSLHSLEATIRWFGSSKFTTEDCTYIDLFQWEDSRADFDPRVFQAFVWAEWESSQSTLYGSGFEV